MVASSLRSVGGMCLEPVHDQTGDFGLTLEMREVPDVGQDDILVWPLEERLNRFRVLRRRIGDAINRQRRRMHLVDRQPARTYRIAQASIVFEGRRHGTGRAERLLDRTEMLVILECR